jgi:hypothetical protein
MQQVIYIVKVKFVGQVSEEYQWKEHSDLRAYDMNIYCYATLERIHDSLINPRKIGKVNLGLIKS